MHVVSVDESVVDAVNGNVGYVQLEGKREKTIQGPTLTLTQAERSNCKGYCENMI